MPFFPLVLLSIKNEEDRAYLDALYRQHCRLMFAAAWKYTSDRSTAEDIVSESIVALIGKVDVLRAMEPAALRSYLVTTVRNAAFSHFRRMQRIDAYRLCIRDEAIARLPEQLPSAPQNELADVIRAMHCMNERDQAVLKMKYFYGLDNGEIARAMNLSPESIRQILSRARKRLKEIIHAEEADEL